MVESKAIEMVEEFRGCENRRFTIGLSWWFEGEGLVCSREASRERLVSLHKIS